MTGNQRRAVSLAQAIIEAGLNATEMSDADWDLLLLAADLRATGAAPAVVARRVMEHFADDSGYFTGVSSAAPARSMNR